jgi:hypothetical protein
MISVRRITKFHIKNFQDLFDILTQENVIVDILKGHLPM